VKGQTAYCAKTSCYADCEHRLTSFLIAQGTQMMRGATSEAVMLAVQILERWK